MKRMFYPVLVTVLLILTPLVVRADSERIRTEFFERLALEKNFGSYDLDVDVRRGKFTVTGSVGSELARARVQEIAETIAGVDTIENRIVVSGRAPRVSLPESGSLAERILARVEGEALRENYRLQVSEDPQSVTLHGVVDTSEGARQIERIASQLALGKRVVNRLQVREELLTDEQLAARVLAALKREPLIVTNDLKISASRGVVTIAGERPNHREIDRILSVVVMVDGVKDVQSQLSIRP